MASYSTRRKIKALVEHYGEEWERQIGDLSVDAAHRAITGDTRKTLYCKMEADIKDQLVEMTHAYGVDIGSLLSKWVSEKYVEFHEQQQSVVANLATGYSR